MYCCFSYSDESFASDKHLICFSSLLSTVANDYYCELLI